MDGFFDFYESQLADLPEPDQLERVSIATDAVYWCAVRNRDQWRQVEEAWREHGRVLDELGRNLHLLLLDE